MKILKHNPPTKPKPKVFKLVLNFLLNGPHKTVSEIFKLSSFRFVTFIFENYKFAIISFRETQNLHYLQNE